MILLLLLLLSPTESTASSSSSSSSNVVVYSLLLFFSMHVEGATLHLNYLKIYCLVYIQFRVSFSILYFVLLFIRLASAILSLSSSLKLFILLSFGSYVIVLYVDKLLLIAAVAICCSHFNNIYLILFACVCACMHMYVCVCVWVRRTDNIHFGSNFIAILLFLDEIGECSVLWIDDDSYYLKM